MAKTVEQIVAHIQGSSGGSSKSYSKEYEKFASKLASQTRSASTSSADTPADKKQEAQRKREQETFKKNESNIPTQEEIRADEAKKRLERYANQKRKERDEAPFLAAEGNIPSTAQIRADAARANMDRYMNSEQRREWQKKQQQNLHAQAMLTGITDGQWTPEVDETEKKIRNEIDYWEAEVQKERDRATAERDMAEVEQWDEADRAELERYIKNKNLAFAQSLNQSFTGLPAEYENSPLIQKYGRERLDEIASTYQREQNRKKYEDAELAGREAAGDGWFNGLLPKFLPNAASIGANLADTLLDPLQRIAQGSFGNDERYTTLDPYAGGQARAYASGVRGQNVENIQGDVYDEEGNLIQDGGKLRELGSIAYQGVMSAADTAARSLVAGTPTVGAGLAAMGSFNSTLSNASAQGATPEQAIALATINSGIEAATEKLPLDELFKVAEGGAKPAAQVVKNVLKQMGIEILEEEASLIGTTLMEAAILRGKSGYNQQIMKAAAQGVPYEQAKAEADRALLAEAINTALVSGVAGLFGAAGAEYAGARFVGDTSQQKATESPQTAQAEEQTQTQEKAEQTVQEAQEQPQAVQEAPTQAQPERRSTVDVLTETITGKSANPAQTSTQQVDTQEQSAEGGQIKGTGAAEADFSGKPAYNATLSADNAQPDRINERTPDVRPMELPKTDIKGGDVSAVTGNVYGSQNTPDDLASAMEEPTARGDFSYIRITNDQATQRAQKTVESAGSWEEARLNFRSEVDRGSAGAEVSARGALILNHYGQAYEQAKASGDEAAAKKAKQEWLSVLSDVQKLGTNTAQGLQAMRIIRNLMPKDKLEFAKAAVRNMVRDMKLNVDIQISEKLLDEYENATTDKQRDEIIGKIQQNVADQIPSTMLDKWNALRYTNMLGNLKTQVRNVAGNAGNSLIYKMKDTAAATIEAVANKVTNGKVGRTKSVIVNKNIQKACGNYYDAVKNAISSGGKYGEYNAASDDFQQGVMDKRKIFKSDNKVLNAVMMPMEAYRNVTNWAMNNKYFGDEAFGKAAFTRAMAGYLQANGVKPGTDLSKVDSGLIEKAMTHAVKEAQEATFHDNSALANVLGKIKKDAGAVGEGIIPFTKTPANVLTRAEEFSPLGIINTAVMAAQKAAGSSKMADGTGKMADWARSGQDITGTDIINSLSKTLTGTALFALGAALKSGGMLTGGPDEDEDEAAFNRLNGIQDYALTFTVNGETHTYTMDWLTPAAMPMFMGSQFMEIASQKDLTFADLEEVFTSIANPMLQMSMLQGLNDSLESIKYSENNLGQFFINAAVNYLTQGLTNTLMGQVEKSTESTRTTTYVDKESQVPQWLQKQLGKASQKILGWDYQQTEYINAIGETEEQPTDAMGWLYNLTSPGYLKKVEVDDVSKELYRIHEATGENVFPESPSTTLTWTDKTGTVHKDYHMTPEQAETLKKETGQTYMRIAEDIIKSKDYNALTEDQAAKALKQAEEYARKRAEIAAIGDNHTGYDEPWMMEMDEGKEAQYILQKVSGSGIASAMTALSTAWKKGYDDTGRSNDLKWAFETFEKLKPAAREEAKEWATGDAARYIEARESGVSHENAVKTFESISSLKPQDGYKEVRDVQKYDAIAKMPGMSEKAKDTLIKAYMPDYDPDARTVNKTELKYDYAREEMGLTPDEYIRAYQVTLEDGDKNVKKGKWRAMGHTEEEVDLLYRLLSATGKTKIDVEKWYNNQ